MKVEIQLIRLRRATIDSAKFLTKGFANIAPMLAKQMESSVYPMVNAIFDLTRKIHHLGIHFNNVIKALAGILGERKDIRGAIGGEPFAGAIFSKRGWLGDIDEMFTWTQNRWERMWNDLLEGQEASLIDLNKETNKAIETWSENVQRLLGRAPEMGGGETPTDILLIYRRLMEEFEGFTIGVSARSRREYGRVTGRGGETEYTGGAMPSPAAQGLADTTKNLAKKQTEKGANALTSMISAVGKASVYAWIMEQLMELFESFLWVLTPFEPLITTLAALMKYAMAPGVIALTKSMADLSKMMWAGRDTFKAFTYWAGRNDLMLLGIVDTLQTVLDIGITTDQWIHGFGIWIMNFAVMIEDARLAIVDLISLAIQPVIDILYGTSPGLIPAFQALYDIADNLLSPFYTLIGYFSDFRTDLGTFNSKLISIDSIFGDFVSDFDWFKGLVEDFSFPSLDGGDDDGGGDDDSEFCKLFPWLCAQHGAYTGSYEGFMKVHPDEHIIPGDQMGSLIGSGRQIDMYYEQRATNEKLDILIALRKRERRVFK